MRRAARTWALACAAAAMVCLAEGADKLLTPEEQARFILPGKPGGYNPHPAGAGLFPLSHSYGTGVEVTNTDRRTQTGWLNVPLPHIDRVWDLSGKLKTGHANTGVNYGHLVQPAFDRRRVRPEDVAALVQARRDRELASGSGQQQPVPVARLPWGYEPVKCRPPACNPMVHHVGTGVEIEPSDDWTVDGALDFPVVQRKSGRWVRFPLSGDLGWETSPIALVYGHGLTPIDPFRRPQRPGAGLLGGQRQGQPQRQRPQWRSQSAARTGEPEVPKAEEERRGEGNFRRFRRLRGRRQKRQVIGASNYLSSGPGRTLWTDLASTDYRNVPPGYDLFNSYPSFLGRLMTNSAYRPHPDRPTNFADLRAFTQEYNTYRRAYYPAQQGANAQLQQAAAAAASGQPVSGRKLPLLPPTAGANAPPARPLSAAPPDDVKLADRGDSAEAGERDLKLPPTAGSTEERWRAANGGGAQERRAEGISAL